MADYVSLPPLAWKPSPNFSARHAPEVRLVVVHDAEGPYGPTINYIQSRTSQVSYHVLLSEDGNLATQFVPWEQKAWSCVQFNSWSDNISIAGRASSSWSYPALNRLARVVAFRLHKRGLPAKFRAAPLDPGNPPKGFTFHSELGAAGGSHHDPGLSGAKKAYFLAAVKWHVQAGHFRRVWGRD